MPRQEMSLFPDTVYGTLQLNGDSHEHHNQPENH